MSGTRRIKGIFVTGTDTGVGKTVVVGLLAKYLSRKGLRVVTQKWIQTGSKDFFDSDAASHIHFLDLDKETLQRYQKHILPYRYAFAASPHLAAHLENRRIVPCKIKKSFSYLANKFDLVVVEGAGGVLVPLDKKNLVIDIAKDLNLPVLVVAQNKLGAINHTLLTIEALQKRKIKILGVVFNNAEKQEKSIIDDNPKIIKSLTRVNIFGTLPWEEGYDSLYKKFMPIGDKIKRELSK